MEVDKQNQFYNGYSKFRTELSVNLNWIDHAPQELDRKAELK